MRSVENANRAAASDFTTKSQELRANAQLQNYSAKQQALKDANEWLDSKRKWIYQTNMAPLERDRMLAELNLAQGKINAEWAMLMAQINDPYRYVALGVNAMNQY